MSGWFFVAVIHMFCSVEASDDVVIEVWMVDNWLGWDSAIVPMLSLGM